MTLPPISFGRDILHTISNQKINPKKYHRRSISIEDISQIISLPLWAQFFHLLSSSWLKSLWLELNLWGYFLYSLSPPFIVECARRGCSEGARNVHKRKQSKYTQLWTLQCSFISNSPPPLHVQIASNFLFSVRIVVWKNFHYFHTLVEGIGCDGETKARSISHTKHPQCAI